MNPDWNSCYDCGPGVPLRLRTAGPPTSIVAEMLRVANLHEPTPSADNGSAEQAIEFALSLPGLECATFLRKWREDDLGDEWPEYFALLKVKVEG